MSYLKQSHGMGTWKTRKLVKGQRASRESGRKKGLVPPQWAKWCAKTGRSYKTDMYVRWSNICDGNKIKWSNA